MAAMPEPWKSLRAAIERIQEEVRQLRNRSPFFGTGFHVTADNGIASDNFDGDLNAGNAGTRGWAMDSDQAAFGELILRPGSIGNDSLTDPLKPQIARLAADGFSLTTSFTTKDSTSVTVPAGFTSVLAILNARLYAVNTNTTGGSDGAGGDAIYVRMSIGASNTVASPTGLTGSNGFTTTLSNDAFLLTGLTPGASLSLSVSGHSAYATIPAYVDNFTVATALLIWLR